MSARRFVLATALGQAIAALVTVPLSLLVSAVAAEGSDGADPRILAFVMVAAGTIEGAITGGAQSLALVADASRRAFVERSALGFAIAWCVGLASSYAEPMAGTGIESRATVLVVAGLQGLVLGLLVGALLAPLLFGRDGRDAQRARRRFVAASALGWSAALVLAAILGDFVVGPSIGLELAMGVTRGLLVGGCAASVLAWTLPVAAPDRPSAAVTSR